MKLLNRETMVGRHEIINRCHIEATTGGDESINQALCTALLRYLSVFAPEASQYQSNERVASDTGMALGTLNSVIKALKGAGMLSRESRGISLTHLWILNWDVIEGSPSGDRWPIRFRGLRWLRPYRRGVLPSVSAERALSRQIRELWTHLEDRKRQKQVIDAELGGMRFYLGEQLSGVRSHHANILRFTGELEAIEVLEWLHNSYGGLLARDTLSRVDQAVLAVIEITLKCLARAQAAQTQITARRRLT
jgi:hypothetical protein